MKKILIASVILLSQASFAEPVACVLSTSVAKSVVSSIMSLNGQEATVYKACESSDEKGVINVVVDDNYSYELWKVKSVQQLGNRNCLVNKVEFVESSNADQICK